MPAQEKKTTGVEAMGQMRALADEVKVLGEEVHTTTDEVQRFLTREVKQHPYRTVLVAFGAGYILAGGLASRLTRQVIRLALRSAAPSLLAAALMKVESAEEQGKKGGNASKSEAAPKS